MAYNIEGLFVTKCVFFMHQKIKLPHIGQTSRFTCHFLKQGERNLSYNVHCAVTKYMYIQAAYAKTKAQISFAATAKRLCFCYTESTIPLLPKFEISSL